MKAVYIDFVPEDNIGVRKKIDYQIQALKDLGVDVVHAHYENGFKIGHEQILHGKIKNKFKRKIFEVYLVYKLLRQDYTEIDFIYLRHVRLTPWFYWMIRHLSKKVKQFYIEIATYPYDGEVSKYSLLSISDSFFRDKISPYVNTIFSFGKSDGYIWGIPAIEMHNAIDLNEIKFYPKINSASGIVNFISVSKLARWHGYDRMIHSLAKLEPEIRKKIVFHVVGDGPEKEGLEKAVEQYGLQQIVKFYGSKQGKELDEIYKQADIAVASLGLYRIGLDEITPIKMSEYTAKGLPFVLASNDPRFIDADFVYKVKNSDEIFDLEDVVSWYNGNEFNSLKIRSYAEKHLDWSAQMKKVLSSFNS